MRHECAVRDQLGFTPGKCLPMNVMLNLLAYTSAWTMGLAGGRMQAQRRVFRVERKWRESDAIVRYNGDADLDRHGEIIAELKALRSLVRPQSEINDKVIEAY